MTDAPDEMHNGTGDETPGTALDAAFLDALADPAKAGEFYGVLLDTMLFLPIDAMPEDEDDGDEAEETASISPQIFELEGEETAMVFDTEERLAAWAEGPTDYVGMPGRSLFLMFDGREQIALNLGVAPSSTILSCDDVAALNAHATHEGNEAEEVPAGTEITVGPVESMDEATVAALVARLAGLRADVAEAVLFSLKIREDDTPRMILGVVPVSLADANETARRVAETVSRIGPSAEGLEVAAMAGDGPVISKARELGLRLPMVDIGSIH